MKYCISITFFFVLNLQLFAQASSSPKNLSTGIELDVLPYATGGWFAAVWAGKKQWRIRALTASVNKPGFTIQKGFTNHQINAYAFLVDRFLNPQWRGVWIGGGFVVWNSTIQSDARIQTSTFTNYLLNGSAGYNIKIHKHIYLSPWAGLSLRMGGDTNVPVDNKLFTLPFVNPEASFKAGIWF